MTDENVGDNLFINNGKVLVWQEEPIRWYNNCKNCKVMHDVIITLIEEADQKEKSLKLFYEINNRLEGKK
jgi:hypothetical protein